MSVNVTWEDVEEFCSNLTEYLSNRGAEVKGVYAPPRGGLCIGVMMSHRLSVPMLMNPCDGCLVVDDIADEGKTLQHIVDDYDCIVATIGYSRQCTFEPEFWCMEKTGEWFEFPWER